MSTYFFPLDLHYFCSRTVVGGVGGKAFYCNTDPNNFAKGTVVYSIQFTADKYCLRSCEVILKGATKSVYGDRTGTYSDTFVFGNGEKLTSLTLYGNSYNGGSASAVAWTTSAVSPSFKSHEICWVSTVHFVETRCSNVLLVM